MPRLALVLFKYFPFGGLQRDFMGIAMAAMARGFQVDIYTMSWEGQRPSGLNVIIIPSRGMSNHQRYCHFIRIFTAYRQQQHYHAVLGFNKIPNLDFYYAADPCFASKYKPWQRYIPRYRWLKHFENSVFARDSNADILALSTPQIQQFQQSYLTPEQRFHLLPPWLKLADFQGHDRALCRQRFADELHIDIGHQWILHVGSGFRTKGLDRSLRALAALPPHLLSQVSFMVIGQDNPKSFKRLADKLNVSHQVHFIGGRSDVAQWMSAADLLLHPAYAENTGNVLLEAIASGLPIMTTAVCGYAEHVKRARAGIVFDEPFVLGDLITRLSTWLTQGLQLSPLPDYLANLDLTSMPSKVVDLIAARIHAASDIVAVPRKQVTQEGWLLQAIATEHPALLQQKKGAMTFNWPAIFKLSGQTARKVSERETLRVVLKSGNYYIKRFLPKFDLKNLWQRYFSINTLGVLPEYNAVNRLHTLEVPTLTVAGFGIERKLCPSSFIFTHEILGVSLEEYCQDWLRQTPARVKKLSVVTQLAATLRVMHHYGINHRDCYLCHFWLNPQQMLPQGDISHLGLWVMDLHRAQMRARVPKRWKIKDLSSLLYSSWQIPLTSRDLCRFIEVYSGMPWRQAYQAESVFWRQVLKKAIHLRQREHRLGLTTPANDWLRALLGVVSQ